MKNLLFVLFISLAFTACQKDEVTQPDAPLWLQQKISQNETAIQSNENSTLKISAWYRYNFNGKIYYEFQNPETATILNLYNESGQPQENLTDDFTRNYQSGKTSKFLVWAGPDFKDFRAENGIAQTLQNTWINSAEEEFGNGVLVYRPAHYKDFPVRRFRHQFIFSEGGQGKTLVLAPNDGHFFMAINWSYTDKLHVLVLKNDGQGFAKFTVTELKSDILKLKEE